MDIKNDVIAAIGNTPLIRLKGIGNDRLHDSRQGRVHESRPVGQGSGRPLHHQRCRLQGELGPGGTIVEGTAGNTGIGLAVVANAMGLRTVIVIPVTQSQEKKDALRQLGAELVEVPAVPYKNPNNYVKYSGRLARAMGGVWANQFDNVANRQAHVETTAPEIWRQTDGKVDAFVSAVGTGGTIAGVSDALKAKRQVIIALADPLGAALYNYYKHGELKAEGSSITEGIGQGRIPGTSKAPSSTRRSRSPMRSGGDRLRSAASTKACAWAARPASMSAAPFAWPNRWGRAISSSRCCATTVRVTLPSCSIRNSCAKRACPFPNG